MEKALEKQSGQQSRAKNASSAQGMSPKDIAKAVALGKMPRGKGRLAVIEKCKGYHYCRKDIGLMKLKGELSHRAKFHNDNCKAKFHDLLKQNGLK